MPIHYYLKPNEVSEIDLLVHTSLKLSVRRRAFAISLLGSEPISKIADRLGVDPKTVRNWWLNYLAFGSLGIGENPQNNKNEEIQQHILRTLEKFPHDFGYRSSEWDLETIREYFFDKLNLPISSSSLNRRLKAGWYFEPNSVSRYSKIVDIFFDSDVVAFFHWLSHPIFQERTSKLRRPVMFSHIPAQTTLYKRQSDEPFRLLIVGVTGKGKSTTVNTLMCNQVATTGDFERTTLDIQKFTVPRTTSHPQIEIIDSPGLCDALVEERFDEKYMNLIVDNIKCFNRLIFVARLDDTRIRPEDMRSIQIVTKMLGRHVWNQSIILFTHADQVPLEKLQKRLKVRASLFRAEIRRYAGHKAAINTRILGLDNKLKIFLYPSQWKQQSRFFIYPDMKQDD